MKQGGGGFKMTWILYMRGSLSLTRGIIPYRTAIARTGTWYRYHYQV